MGLPRLAESLSHARLMRSSLAVDHIETDVFARWHSVLRQRIPKHLEDGHVTGTLDQDWYASKERADQGTLDSALEVLAGLAGG